MSITCDWEGCEKKARWALIDMESYSFLDGRDNEFPVRESYLYCGEHKQGMKNVYAVSVGELIHIKGQPK
jgi:hypothetical protein